MVLSSSFFSYLPIVSLGLSATLCFPPILAGGTTIVSRLAGFMTDFNSLETSGVEAPAGRSPILGAGPVDGFSYAVATLASSNRTIIIILICKDAK
jgi:hypothetical protein